MSGPHPSHSLRSSDAGSFDVICRNCGHTDGLGTWGKLVEPCPKAKPLAEPSDDDTACNFCGKLSKDNPGRVLVHENGNAICSDCVAGAVLSFAEYAAQLLGHMKDVVEEAKNEEPEGTGE